jgi:hypothetical protein
MALMGRSLGIPSRVAVGFLRPDRVARDTYVYSSHDLHAWPEMYFGGVGWVRFEPTPQGRATNVPAYTTQEVPRADPAQSSSAPAAAPSLNRIDRTLDPAAADDQGGGGATLGNPLVLFPLLGALVLGLLLLAPRTARTLVRRRRWAAATSPVELVEAGWREIRDSAVDLGLVFDDRLTLRAAAGELVHTFGSPGDDDDALGRGTRRGRDAAPEAAAALDRMVRLVERARYARSLPTDAVTAEQVRGDVASCEEAMRAGAGRRRRSRAAWLPASLATPAGATRRRTRREASMFEPGVDRAV